MWSDKETNDDCLGFSSYVTVISQICIEKDIAPLTLGIFGSWGSGKSSLMRMIKADIDRTAAEKKIKTVWFNAWRYEGKEEAQSALIHSVLNKISEDSNLVDQAKDVFNRLRDGASVLKLAKFIGKTAITMTPDIDAFVKCFREESEKVAETMEKFETDFEELLEKMKVDRIVVFIDDLDRCQSVKVIETFETIKLFLNIPKCTFVIGADPGKIEQAIGDTYRVGEQSRAVFSKDYLEKIIQLPFRIPEQQLLDIQCYVGMLILRRYLGAESWRLLLTYRSTVIQKPGKIQETFNEWALANQTGFFESKLEAPLSELKNTLPYVNILAQGLRGNPRQIKRFLNILGLRQRLAAQNELKINPEILIKFTVLEYAWPDFFTQVAETFDPSSGSSTLLLEVLKKDAEKTTDSALVKMALESPGLLDFLKSEPVLGGEIDLNPYLFLAQTAFSGRRTAAISTPDELAKSLASRIANEDRIRSESAARQAAKADPSIIASIVRTLIPQVIAPENDKLQVHILSGLDIICGQQKAHYQDLLLALNQIDVKSKSAAAFVGATIVANAEKASIPVDAALKEKFVEASSSFGRLLNPRKQRR